MIDGTASIPEVVAEVRALFERYEQALIDKNVDVLDDGAFVTTACDVRRPAPCRACRSRRARASSDRRRGRQA